MNFKKLEAKFKMLPPGFNKIVKDRFGITAQRVSQIRRLPSQTEKLKKGGIKGQNISDSTQMIILFMVDLADKHIKEVLKPKGLA